MFRQVLITLCAIVALAQSSQGQSVGEWYVFPRFTGEAQSFYDTQSMVYYVSGGSLYSYNKDTNESYTYSTQNKLADTNITLAKYNPEEKYLLVVYNNANIDMVYDNGRVVNLPDIKDAALSVVKTVNDVTFNDGKIYVATSFGLVIFDSRKHQVIESGVYNQDLQFVFICNGNIMVYPRESYTIYRAPIEGRHNTWDVFNKWYGMSPQCFITTGDDFYYINSSNNNLYYIDVTADMSDYNGTALEILGGKYLQEGADGNIHTQTDTEIITLDRTGNIVARKSLDDTVKNQLLVWNKDFNSVWGIDASGVANYDLSSGTPTLLADKMKPEATTVDQVAYLNVSADGSRIYASNIGDTGFKTVGWNGGALWLRQYADCIENGRPFSVALTEATNAQAGSSADMQATTNTKYMFGGPSRLTVDPENPRRYYQGNATQGLFVCEDGKEIQYFNSSNTPMLAQWTVNRPPTPRVYDVNFDPEGNLWVGSWFPNNTNNPSYIILPREKVRGDLSKVTKDDWIKTKLAGTYIGAQDMGSVICKKSNMVIIWDGGWSFPVYAYDTKGTYTNTGDDTFMSWKSFTDQDGNTFAPVHWVCGVEDQKGRVWLGSTTGIVELTRPDDFTNATARVKRLKVPRNDGTGLADYLLSTDQINCIAVDGINRKWIATESSGLYLVSEDGDQILQHFTADNSPLPSNAVYSVACDPKSNYVYIGLATGLVRYSSTASPSHQDYSEVYAYPNPVRPDYTGWITITGLMENSLVKIADTAGNVLYQGRSEGGMIAWDGCDAAGNRVHSGVYLVFASQNENGSSSAAVTKIVVIN